MTSKRLVAIRSAVSAGLSVCFACGPARADDVDMTRRAAFTNAVAYCRDKPGVAALDESAAIFCFDGNFSRFRDTSSLSRLNDGGLFVVRSLGGDGYEAMRIADVLSQKCATVVIYDYCFGSCSFFIFVASGETYVARESIVAWRSPVQDWRFCKRDGGWLSEYCYDTLAQQKYFLSIGERASSFYQSRILNPFVFGFWYPPIGARAKMARSRLRDDADVTEDEWWTWNPRYYKKVLRTHVTYESYFKTDQQVDELKARLGLSGRRIILDD